jgi:uncharacterized protein (TIGR03435 family)
MARFKRTGKRLPTAISLLFITSVWAQGQAATSTQSADDAPPIKFAVVSIKQNRSDDQKLSFSAPRNGDSVSYTNYPLFYLVIFSNDFHRSDLVSGLPEWTKNERYDVVAKVAPEDIEKYHALSQKQFQAMVQQVLTDRFKLQFHLEPKELPVLEMTIAKSGPKLKVPDPDTPLGLKTKYGQPILLVSRGDIEAEGVTIPDLATFLTAISHSGQFVDKTGLAGKYDFTLKFAQETESVSSETEPDTPSTSPNPPLPTALREQLGIQLRSGKAFFDCFIVDHIERPTPN